MPDAIRLAYVTQTTLSVDDTAGIVAVLRALPGDRRAAQGGHLLRHHQPPARGEGDRAAVDLFLVVGAPNSSNSMRLVEVARQRPARALIWCTRPRSTGPGSTACRPRRTAGASAPEMLVEEVIDAFRRATVTVEDGAPTRSGHLQAAAELPAAPACDDRRWRSTPTSPPSWRLPRRLRARRAAGAQGHRRGGRELELPAPDRAGRYILTLYEKRVDPRRPAVLPGPDGASGRPRAACPLPSTPATGRRCALCGRPAAISQLPRGHVAAPDHGRALRPLGEALADLHLAAADFALTGRQRALLRRLAGAVRAAAAARPTRSSPGSRPRSRTSSPSRSSTGRRACRPA